MTLGVVPYCDHYRCDLAPQRLNIPAINIHCIRPCLDDLTCILASVAYEENVSVDDYL